MSRGWMAIALLLSLGVNLGLVGTAVARRHVVESERDERPRVGRATEAERPVRAEDERAIEPAGLELGGRLADRLELEGERRERFQAALGRTLLDVGAARDEITHIRKEMRREVAARDSDRARIDALLRELESAEAKLNRAFVEGILDAKAELGPEKAREFLKLVAELGLARPPIEGRRFGTGAPLPGRRLGGDRRAEAPEPEPTPVPTPASVTP